MSYYSGHCNLCDNKTTSFEKGFICNVTNNKPNFKETCPEIKFENNFLERIESINLDGEIIRKVKKSTFLKFYSLTLSGLILILVGVFIAGWITRSLYVWHIKILIVGMGISFIGTAFYNRKVFKQKEKQNITKKRKIDELLKTYGITYVPSFEFENKVHGMQEVKVKLEFENWSNKNTSANYSIKTELIKSKFN